MYMYIYMYVYVCTYVCMYVYIYMYIYEHSDLFLSAESTLLESIRGGGRFGSRLFFQASINIRQLAWRNLTTILSFQCKYTSMRGYDKWIWPKRTTGQPRDHFFYAPLTFRLPAAYVPLWAPQWRLAWRASTFKCHCLNILIVLMAAKTLPRRWARLGAGKMYSYTSHRTTLLLLTFHVQWPFIGALIYIYIYIYINIYDGRL